MKLSLFGGHPIQSDLSESKVSARSPVTDQKVQDLKDLGITDYEQLYALVRLESLRPSLLTLLGTDGFKLQKIVNEAESAIGGYAKMRIYELNDIDHPTGALEPKNIAPMTDDVRFFESELKSTVDVTNYKQIMLKEQVESFGSTASPISQINFVRQLPRVRNQGDRGTCVAFAVTCINEFASQNPGYPDLSEQHLYFETKAIDNSPNICGTWISNACQVLGVTGQCREVLWSYNPNPPCNQIGRPQNALSDALQYVKGSVQINPSNLNAIKSFLVNGKLVAFAIPVFNSWARSGETARSGRITMPLPNEKQTGGHAMTLVGFQDDLNYPGGGYFIFRNSWGEAWASENVYAPGYGIIPYAFIKKYCWEAFAVA